ncbi:MAG: YcxB family protein [Oscillospiraceae bacterium]
MLDKMFDEAPAEQQGNYPDELLAEGEYESDPDDIIKGFKVFQKRHVYGNLVLQLFLVALAIASQVLSIMYNHNGDIMMNVTLIVCCVFLGIWLLLRPVNTLKNLRKGIEDLKGTIYKAEMFADKIKISTIYDAPVENEKAAQEEAPEASDDAEGSEEDEDVIPATIIHLENAGVEITETEKLYVVYVKKVNIFVIPKAAFSDEENKLIAEKYEILLGVRFKPYEK